MDKSSHKHLLKTLNGTIINAELIYRPYYLKDFPYFKTRMIEFGFEILQQTSKPDPFIERRLIEFLNGEINWQNEVLLIFYDNRDKRPKARRRLFNRWFQQLQTETVEKQDFEIWLDTNQLVFLSVFIGKENLERELLMDVFYRLKAQYDKFND